MGMENFPSVRDWVKKLGRFDRNEYKLNLQYLMVVCLCLAFALAIEDSDASCFGQAANEREGSMELTNSIGMKLVLIPKGTFTMGSPQSEAGRDSFGRDQSETQHEVTISQDFYLGATEVTQGQYNKAMGVNPSIFQGEKASWQLGKRGKPVDTSNYPVDFVEWDDAVEFCKKLSELPEEVAAGRQYRLPTEAEWEYSCRAGSKTAFCFGEDVKLLGQYAWFTVDPEAYQNVVIERAVARLKPNCWGLYDMHGSMAEWCSDWAGPLSADPVTDPSGPPEGDDRVLRGGSHGHEAHDCRSAKRGMMPPWMRSSLIGFRVVLNVPNQRQK